MDLDPKVKLKAAKTFHGVQVTSKGLSISSCLHIDWAQKQYIMALLIIQILPY